MKNWGDNRVAIHVKIEEIMGWQFMLKQQNKALIRVKFIFAKRTSFEFTPERELCLRWLIVVGSLRMWPECEGGSSSKIFGNHC